MKWTVNQLQKQKDQVMRFSETADVEKELIVLNPEIRKVSPVLVEGTADIDSRKVTFHLHLAGEFILPCSRTLADVKYPFDVRSQELFLLNPSDYERGDLEEIHEVEGGVIDLTPIIHELLLLEIPMQVFCDSPEEQSAPMAGKGWEVMTEEELQREQESKVDPRLAGLAQFFEGKDEQ